MIFLYTLVLLLLGVAKFLIGRRVAGLEAKYARAAQAANQFVREPHKEGNGSRPDPYQNAKRQYLLGVLVQKRDRLEALHEIWQGRLEKFASLVNRVKGWMGQKLPYTFGVLDVSFALWLIDYLGVAGIINPRALVELVTSVLSRG